MEINHLNASDQYEALVTALIREMEAGNLLWRQPWFSRFPCNLHTGKNYRGINVFSLNWSAQSRGFASRFWITKKQAAARGGAIKTEEEARPSTIIFGKWVYKPWRDKRGVEHTEVRLLLRGYSVYNLEQTHGLEHLVPKEHCLAFKPLERAERIVQDYRDPPHFELDTARAYYAPLFDIVGLPAPSQFVSAQSYYATCFHELIHSTGDSHRLNRFSFRDTLHREPDQYAKEELVAEIGAAFLCAEAGIANETIKDSAAYLAYWLNFLKKDRKALFWAAAAAQKGADWILNRRQQKPPSETPQDDTPFGDDSKPSAWE